MTFNTTSLYVGELKAAGFVEVFPLRARSEAQVRRVFMKPEMVDLLNGKSMPPQGFPATCADEVIGRYCAGWLIRVSEKSNKSSELEKLQDLNEAWALCFRSPKPGWRVLGRFMDKDIFVGMRIYDRHELAPSTKYEERAKEIIAEWGETFPHIPPVSGSFPDAYISGVYINVDE